MAPTVVVAGVGSGLGASLVRKFVKEGCRVGMFARSESFLKKLAGEMHDQPGAALAVPTDLTRPEEIAQGFRRVREQWGSVDTLIYHAGNAKWGGLQEITAEQFSEAWNIGPYAGFLCVQEVVPDMLEKGQGVILFTGATSSVRGRGGAVAFSSAKFGVRGLAQSLARELWPKGIHVGHVVIDGVIETPHRRQYSVDESPEPLLDPHAMAEAYWHLSLQERHAWTFELDLRPFEELFFD